MEVTDHLAGGIPNWMGLENYMDRGLHPGLRPVCSMPNAGVIPKWYCRLKAGHSSSVGWSGPIGQACSRVRDKVDILKKEADHPIGTGGGP